MEVETPDWEGVAGGGHLRINCTAAMEVAQLLTRTTPYTTALHAQAQCFRIVADCALHLNSVAEPILIAIDCIVRQHRSLILKGSNDRALQQPPFCGLPETTVVCAVD